MPSWKKVLISGSDAALNSLNVTAALTASGIIYPSSDGTSGQVLVTNGSGQLSFSTISSGGTGSSVKLSQTVGATTWSFAHNLNEKFPAVTIYDSNDEVIIPQKIDAIDNNNMLIYFSSPTTGTAAAVVGGSTVSSSYSLYAETATSASYAQTASLALSSQNAQDILVYVKNTTGAQINKGTVVRILDATGDNPLIATASYSSEGLSANTLGITNENIINDGFGYVMTEGKFLGLNTDAYTAGQLLYLGAGGTITGTVPVAPLHAVRLGQVLRVQQNNGSMYVRIDNGYELGELHNVNDTSNGNSYGDLLMKSGSVWTNTKQLSGSYSITGSLNSTIQFPDNSATPSAANAGSMRYRVSGNNSYVDMVMQTGATTYTWVNIVQNNW
jgi:hypothetical protein